LEARGTNLEPKFLDYIAKNGKNYKSVDELNKRHTIWKETDLFIKNYNPDGFTMAHNKFSDMTPQEKNKMLGLRKQQKKTEIIADHSYEEESNHQKLEAFWIFGSCPTG
jgi:hypothetical protein